MAMKHNLFEFNGDLYQQLIGVAMGSRPAPSVADNFLARFVDKIILKKAQSQNSALKVLKRFLDDLFSIYTGSTTQLHKLFNEINSIHPNIKFTMNHTTPIENDCGCENTHEIPFLDTALSIKEGQNSG